MLTEKELAKLLARAGLKLEKQERVPEAERAYKYRYSEDEPWKDGLIEYDFYFPQRIDDPHVSRDLWRIRFPDGSLSDLANLTRIEDAALTLANKILKEETK